MESERMHPTVVTYDYAMSFVGQPYRWGGDDPMSGLDCSGLCIEILQSAGVFPHGQDTTADGLRSYYSTGKTKSPSFGALAFFGKDKATHVGFMLNDLSMLEAGGGGSNTNTLADAINQNAYVRIRPYNTRKDFLGFYLPAYPW